MLPVLAYPVVAVGLALSVMIGGMGMANIEDYRSQIEQKQSYNQDAKDNVDEIEDCYLDYEDDYIKQGIKNTEEGVEIDQDYIDFLADEALDTYCNETDMDFGRVEINYIKKQLPEFVKSIIDREESYKGEKAFAYYIRHKHHNDSLEWLRRN